MEFIPATSFFITVIGVRQRQKEKKRGVKMEKRRERAKVNRTEEKSTKAKNDCIVYQARSRNRGKEWICASVLSFTPFVPSNTGTISKSQR